MIKNIYSTLDIKDLEVKQIGNVKQYDDIILTLEIRENDKTISIVNNEVILKVTREDNEVFIQDKGITINGNLVVIKLNNISLDIVGVSNFELEITNVDGSISTASFQIKILKAISKGNAPIIPIDMEKIKTLQGKVSELTIENINIKKDLDKLKLALYQASVLPEPNKEKDK